MNKNIVLKGVETHNLKNIDMCIHKNSLNLIVGPSGSGKSSLAYDTIAQIGQYEFMSMFADNIVESSYKLREYNNMVAAVPIKQNNNNNNIRSTIGTYFGLNPLVALLYAFLHNKSEDFFVLNKESNLCPCCHGLGVKKSLDLNKIIKYEIPIINNPFKCWNKYKDFYSQILEEYCNDEKIDVNKTFKDITQYERDKLLYGISKKKYSITYKKVNAFSRRTTKFKGVMTEDSMMPSYNISQQYYSDKKCDECNGKKFSKEYDNYKIFGMSIGEFMVTPFDDLKKIIRVIKAKCKEKKLEFAINNLNKFIDKAIELNLGHLYLHRSIPTLSGGELQRLRLVQVFNTQLTDLLIVLDEPLAGLAKEEKKSVYKNVVSLSPMHTVIVVDHGETFAKIAKNIVALGKGGGNEGGYLVNVENYFKNEKKKYKFSIAKESYEKNVVLNSNIYDYKGVRIQIGIEGMNLVTGRSGIGKTTLLKEYFPQYFDKYEYISQKSLVGNRNSTIASVLNVTNDIANIFARKFNKNKNFFSNLTGNEGACKVCNGAGFIEYNGSAQGKIQLRCNDCEGTGFNNQLKKYLLKEKSIYDIWSMTIEEAIKYFDEIDKKISNKLKCADEVLLGYLKLGQLTETLSGGENVRLKLIRENSTTSLVMGIDEPFKGLGNKEIYSVVCYLEKLRAKGKTIIVVDHNEEAFQYFGKVIKLVCEKNILIGKCV